MVITDFSKLFQFNFHFISAGINRDLALLGTLEGADMDQDDAFMDIDQQQLIGSSTTTFSAQPNNARRAPVMGNRGLESQHRVQREQERSRTKSKTFPQKEPKSSSRSSPRSSRRSGTAEKSNSGSSGVVQVAALDERNLKKIITLEHLLLKITSL